MLDKYNAFEHLHRSVFPISATERLMVMLTVYVDESGTDGQSALVALAGYLSDVDSWDAFQTEWNAYRKLNGIDVFHATDLRTNHGAFSAKNGWSRSRCNSALRIADNIISKHTMQAVVGYTTIAECEELYPLKDPRLGYRRKYSMEYLLAGIGFIKVLRQWARKKGYTEPIRFVFENGANGKGYLMHLLDHVKKTDNEDGLIGGHSFEDKNCVVQLHAADRIANLACRDINRYRRGSLKPDFKLGKKLKLDNCQVSILDEENWPAMKAMIQPVLTEIYEKAESRNEK